MKKFLISYVLIAAALSGNAQDVVEWRFALTDAGDGRVDLSATATVKPGWHIYGIDIPDGGPNATEMSFEELRGAAVEGGMTARGDKFSKAYDEVFAMQVESWEGEVEFIRRLKVTDTGAFGIRGEIRAQACDAQSCTPPLPAEFSFTAADLPAGFAAAVDDASDTTGNISLPTPANTSPPPSREQLWAPVTDELNALGTVGDSRDISYWRVLLFGLAGGLLALLTPCVWPMIPLTVSFFLKRISNRGKAVRDALTYGAAIVVIYVGLGLAVTAIFGAAALNTLSTSALFNLIFFTLLVLFSVSFFGAFDMTLPSSWSSQTDEKASTTKGVLSIFFMAFTLAIVSFSCTGPVIGWLLVEAASSGALVAPAVGMLGFATALAIPFALFALFPSWLDGLPRSGGWLNSVKVVLGFLELALALKFLSVADLAYGWGILDREVFLVLWIVIFAILGIYLLGKLKFPHDTPVEHTSVPRLFLAILSLSFALYMVPGLWGAPLKAISAFSPPLYTQDFNLYKGEIHAAFDDYDAGMEYARREGKSAVVDFSGYGCVNCRKMEAAVWTDPRVKQMLEEDYVLITLMVDDRERLSEAVEVEERGRTVRIKTIGDKWSYLQRHKFGTSSQPCYVLLAPDGTPLAPLYAFDTDVERYLEWLRSGLEVMRIK